MGLLMLFLLFLTMPAASEAQNIKAYVGKKNIYLESGKVEGGQVTDGKNLSSIRFGRHDTFERLVLDIHEWTGDTGEGPRAIGAPASIPAKFWISYEAYPCRLVFQLEGIRWRSADFPNFTGSNYIRDMYNIHSLDWGNERFAVIFQKPIAYEVYEQHHPAEIVIDFKEAKKSADEYPPVYSLRTESFDYDWKKLFDLEEKLSAFDGSKVRVLKSSDNKYLIEEGYYKTWKQASIRQKTLAKEGVTLFVEKRKVDEIPKAMKK